MASSTVLSRLSSRLQPLAVKLNKRSLSANVSPIKSSSQPQTSASARRISRMSRLPVELSSLESMMPLHSAIASARLRSSLSIESQSWGLIPQGLDILGLTSPSKPELKASHCLYDNLYAASRCKADFLSRNVGPLTLKD